MRTRWYSRLSAFTLGLAVSGLVVAPASAQVAVSFTDVANTLSSEFETISTPSINAGGTLAFSAVRDGRGSGQGVYTAFDTAGFNTVARSDTSPEFRAFANRPIINTSGAVAFAAERDGSAGGGQAIYTAVNTDSFTRIARSESDEFALVGPRIGFNDAGVVAFFALRTEDGSGIYTATSEASFNTIARTDLSPEFDTVFSPDINNAGTVSFFATRDISAGGGQGIYKADSLASFTTIGRTDSPEFNSFAELASINNAGTVGFFAFRDFEAGGGEGVYTAQSSASFGKTASTEAALFSALGVPALNDTGTIAFLGDQPDGSRGIFALLPGQSAPSPVIKTGDTLFGQTVTNLDFSRDGLNDANEVAFFYGLANGVQGVARARVSFSASAPEPGTLGMVSIGVLLAAVVVARRLGPPQR